MEKKDAILNGEAVLGIEFGSTRIKAVLIDRGGAVLAVGAYDWENKLENGLWTYSRDEIHAGLVGCYAALKQAVRETYGVTLQKLAALGFSGMMHGYLPFDAAGNLLTPFRTWRNTVTGQAADELTALFDFNIPQRWSVAHLWQAVLNGEEHVAKIDFFTTLAGYIHTLLTGEKVLGVGEASGMFPVDSETGDWNEAFLQKFDALAAGRLPKPLRELLPAIRTAGEEAGLLTPRGARFLDPEGDLQPGVPVCPPEGDAGTGMVATNSVRKRTGNVSAGTSVFLMVVLERALRNLHRELDIVTTPDGAPVAMVHCNNCTSDINAWVSLFGEVTEAAGGTASRGQLFEALFREALDGDEDCGGVLSYNYFSGEHITGFTEGRPLLMRQPDARFTLANFMRAQLFTCFGAIRIGFDILEKEENVAVDTILGHGGFFKTPVVGQSVLAAAMNAPVSVMATAGEGGAWGIAVLADYLVNNDAGETLPDFLDNRIFASLEKTTLAPDPALVASFGRFMQSYRKGLSVERAALEV